MYIYTHDAEKLKIFEFKVKQCGKTGSGKTGKTVC